MDRIIIHVIGTLFRFGRSEQESGKKLRLLGLFVCGSLLCVGLYFVFLQFMHPELSKLFAILLFFLLLALVRKNLSPEEESEEPPLDQQALAKLDEMKAAGLIDEAEYKRKKQELIGT